MSAPLLVGVLAVLGAVLGSFANVLAHRGPSLWGLVEPPARPSGAYDLSTPRSHCPACLRPLRWWELIPIASYLAARGRCSSCRSRISPRYLVLEVAGAASGAGAALLLPPPAALVALCLVLLVATAAVVDAETGYLPDALTFPALWLALLAASFDQTVPPAAAIVGAASGYGAFWLAGLSYRAARGRDGLGLGDAKLLAVGGAWLGPLALPFVVLVAACSGIAFALATGRRERDAAIRFGPHLAVGIVALATLTTALPGRVVPLWSWG